MAAGARLVTLPDGRVLGVRPVGADDVDGLAALYAGLDDDARYRRFFSIYRPPRSFVERLASIEDRGGRGLVATVRDGDGPAQVVGEAGYELLANGNGELAITIDRAWRGWLGPYLLDCLLEAAADAGVTGLEADVLCSNLAMLSLLRSRGYALMPQDEPSVVRLLVPTEGRGRLRWPRRHDAPRLLVEGCGGSWRGATAAARAGVQVLGCPGPEAPANRCPAARGEPCPLAEGADAVLLNRPGESAAWDALRDAHARLHPEVPVLVDRRGGDGELRSGEVDVTGHDPARVLHEAARHARSRRAARVRRLARARRQRARPTPDEGTFAPLSAGRDASRIGAGQLPDRAGARG